MRKWQKIIGILAGIVIMFFMFCGATMFSGKSHISVYCQEKKLLEKEYKIKTPTLMSVIFKYKADFYKFYKANKNNSHVRDFSCINEDIKTDLDEIINQVEYDSVDSQLIWDKSSAEFEIVEGKNGKIVNQNTLIESLYKGFGKTTRIDLQTEDIPQNTTKEDLEKRCKKRAEFSTSYPTSSANRKHNIKTATERINGLRVSAGEELSFNDVVGPRTEANGFLQSKIISGGAFVAGTGGGVCQVSTTLFNTWVRAGLEVVNAKNHSLCVSYVPPSMDAMVSSRTDLKLKNNSDYDVFIKAYNKNDSINIIIYGYEMNQKIELRNKILKIISCNEYDEIKAEIDWKEGERIRVLSHPKNGLVSAAYKDVYENGILISSTKIRTNTYLPQKGRLVRREDMLSQEKESPTKEKERPTEKKESINFTYDNPFSGVFNGISLFYNLVS